MTCARCEELEERVAWLEGELALQHDADAYQRLRKAMWFPDVGRATSGRRGPVRFVLALYAAKGRTMTKEQILEAVPPPLGGEDERVGHIVPVWACYARKSLGREAIENVWGRGYRLSPSGLAKIAEILAAPRTATASAT